MTTQAVVQSGRFGAAAFSPDDLANLKFWIDASDASTFTYGTGTQVSQWNDKSGNGYHVSRTASTAVQRNATINSLDAVTFTTSGVLTRSSMDPTTFVDSTDTMVFAVVKPTGNASNVPFALFGGPSTSRVALDYRAGGTQTYWDVFNNANFPSGRLSGNSFSLSLNTVYLWSCYRSGGTMKVRLNGVEQLSTTGAGTTAITSSSGTLKVGQSDSGFTDGLIAEVVVVKGYNSSDFTSVEDYLNDKWAVY